jgi:hypothetical protein
MTRWQLMPPHELHSVCVKAKNGPRQVTSPSHRLHCISISMCCYGPITGQSIAPYGAAKFKVFFRDAHIFSGKVSPFNTAFVADVPPLTTALAALMLKTELGVSQQNWHCTCSHWRVSFSPSSP